MLLMIDNYDSFVYNLYQYWLMLGEDVRVVRNDAITVDEVKDLDGGDVDYDGRRTGTHGCILHATNRAIRDPLTANDDSRYPRGCGRGRSRERNGNCSRARPRR